MKHLYKIIIITAAVLLFFSCSEGLYTIFNNIVDDTPITDNQLENNLNVMAMGKTTSNNYYIACGDMRRRSDSGIDWSRISVSGGIHNTLAVDGNIIYVGVVYTDGIGKLFSY